MKFSFVIKGAPYSCQASSTALNTVRACISQGHEVYRLFFFEDGVHNASSLVVPLQDEVDIPRAWAELIVEHKLDAVVCVSSALKRGILDQQEAERYERGQGNLLPEFTISGLGQWLDACQQSDRVLQFAA